MSGLEDDGRINFGDIYEGENDFGPFYNDLIQRVKLVKFENGWFKGFIIGFDQRDAGKWRREELHALNEPRRPDIHIGDEVHFQVTEDRYGIDEDGRRMKLADADQILEGFLWCKGKLVAINDDQYIVQHTAWNALDRDATTTTNVPKKLVRSSYITEE